MVSGGELAYQQLCSEMTVEFNDCSKQVGTLCDQTHCFKILGIIIIVIICFFILSLKLNWWVFISVQVLEMESLFLKPDYCRIDLAQLLRAVQAQEKQKLHLVFLFPCS